MKTFKYDGIVYQISSYSGENHKCVGVSIESDAVRIINTNHPDQKGVFTHDEWEAFIQGVKENEFNLKNQ